jgi:hypothetical protein
LFNNGITYSLNKKQNLKALLFWVFHLSLPQISIFRLNSHIKHNFLEYNEQITKRSKESNILLPSNAILVFIEFVRFLPTEVVSAEIYRSLLGETTDWITLFHFVSFISLSYHKFNYLHSNHNNDNESDTKTIEFEPLEYMILLLEMIEKYMKEALQTQEDSKLQGTKHFVVINKTIKILCVCVHKILI